jgi:hypothetical protein
MVTFQQEATSQLKMIVASSCSDVQHLVLDQTLKTSFSYHPSLFETNSVQQNTLMN